MELAEGDYKKQNFHLEAQKKYLKEKYDAEIKIAELEGNTVKKQKLQAEYQKELRDLTIQQYQNEADAAQDSIDELDARIALEEGNYKKQNAYIEEQKKYLREKYESEINIAKVNGKINEQKKLEIELQKELNDLTKDQFDNIAEDYARLMKINSDVVSLIQSDLGIAEAKGEIIGSEYYTAQMNLNNEQIKTYNEQIKEQTEELENLTPYSPEWYDALDQILQAQIGLKGLEEENVNLQNSINRLKFDRFDDLLDKLNDITDETDFLISLLDSDNLFDDNGKITDDGLTAIGLTAMNYDTYMAQADKYKGMIAEVEEMYAQGLIGYEEYISKTREYQQGQRQSIKSAKDCEKAINDYVKQGLDAQNEALSEAIDKQRELLRSEKDLYDFQKKISDQNKNIANLKKQIASLEGDDSEENRKKLQQLKSDLANAEQEQKDTLYDRSISDQEDALDEMLKNSMDAAEEYLSDSERVFIDSLNYVNSHTSQVANNLEAISKEVGYDISSNISNAWEGAGNAVDTYQNILAGNVPGITAQIGLITSAWQEATEAAEKAASAIVTDTQNNSNMQDQANQKVVDYINSHLDLSKNPNSLGVLNKKIYEWSDGYMLSPAEQIELGKLLGIEVPDDVSKFTQEHKRQILEALEKLNLKWRMGKAVYTPKGFATGGIIDTKDILKRSGEQGFIIANNGEAVLTNQQWKLIREFANGLNNIKIQTPKLPEIQSRNMQSPVYHIDNSITVDGIATDQIVKDMEKVAQKQAENTISKINSITYSKGVRYK